MPASRTVYHLLDVLKPVAPDIWIVDTPPPRTGNRNSRSDDSGSLEGGDLWLHSPTRYDEALGSELHRIGTIRHLVAPNVAHWSFLKDWQARCPGVVTWAAPGLRQRLQVKKSGVALDHDLGLSPERLGE